MALPPAIRYESHQRIRGEKYRFFALKFDGLKRGGARVQSESPMPENLGVQAAPSSGDRGRRIYLWKMPRLKFHSVRWRPASSAASSPRHWAESAQQRGVIHNLAKHSKLYLQSVALCCFQGFIKSFLGNSTRRWAIIQLWCSQAIYKLWKELLRKINRTSRNNLVPHSVQQRVSGEWRKLRVTVIWTLKLLRCN